MDRLPLNALRALALVLERGGVRSAARDLGISHSAVSRHLKELERWLGVQLLEKGDARALHLTAEGVKLAEAARQGLHAITQAVEAIREQRSPFSVSISTTPSFAVRWLLPRLPALQRAYPRLEASVMVEQRLEQPHSFFTDIAIRTGSGPWAGLSSEALMDDSLYPVMSPALWQRCGRPREPAALNRVPLLHDRDPRSSWLLWRQHHGPATLEVRRGARFASSDLVLRAAAQGLGVALAHHRLVQADMLSGALLRPFGERSVSLGVTYWIVRPQGATSRAALNMLLDWLRGQARTPMDANAGI